MVFGLQAALFSATYGRRGGGGQQRQDPAAGDDDVIHHLRDEMDGVVDEDDVLVTVHEVHHRFSRVTGEDQREEEIIQDSRGQQRDYSIKLLRVYSNINKEKKTSRLDSGTFINVEV